MAETQRKRPWLAAALTLISPGLGHLYLREWFRAVLWFGLILGATSILVPVSPSASASSFEGILEASVNAAGSVPLRNQLALLAITALSMADAYWMATRGNQVAAAAEGVRCPHCGKELDEDLEFCHWCTSRLDVSE